MLLKYLSNFWRTLEIALINSEVNVILNWYKQCIISFDALEAQSTAFVISDTKLCVPVVTLSTHDNPRLFAQLKLDFKRSINWNEYQSKPIIYAQNPYLDYLIDPRFQGTNRHLCYCLKKMHTKQVTKYTFFQT